MNKRLHRIGIREGYTGLPVGKMHSWLPSADSHWYSGRAMTQSSGARHIDLRLRERWNHQILSRWRIDPVENVGVTYLTHGQSTLYLFHQTVKIELRAGVPNFLGQSIPASSSRA